MMVEVREQEGVLRRQIGSHRGLLVAVSLIVFWWTAMAAGLALAAGSIWGSLAVGALFTVATLRVIRGPWGAGLISAKLSKPALYSKGQCNASLKTSAGVLKPNVFRGRPLSSRAIFDRSVCV